MTVECAAKPVGGGVRAGYADRRRWFAPPRFPSSATSMPAATHVCRTFFAVVRRVAPALWATALALAAAACAEASGGADVCAGCPQGFICVGNRCLECVDDGGCPIGQICDLQINVCRTIGGPEDDPEPDLPDSNDDNGDLCPFGECPPDNDIEPDDDDPESPDEDDADDRDEDEVFDPNCTPDRASRSIDANGGSLNSRDAVASANIPPLSLNTPTELWVEKSCRPPADASWIAITDVYRFGPIRGFDRRVKVCFQIDYGRLIGLPGNPTERDLRFCWANTGGTGTFTCSAPELINLNPPRACGEVEFFADTGFIGVPDPNARSDEDDVEADEEEIIRGPDDACGTIGAGEPRTRGMAAVADITKLPALQSGVQSYLVSSRDPTGGNADNNGSLDTDGGRFVLLRASGPGCVTRMWFDQPNLGGNLQFTLDDDEQPRFDWSLGPLMLGNYATQTGFAPPFVGVSGGTTYYSYYPVCWRCRAKIATTSQVGYYQINYETYAVPDGVEAYTGAEDRTAAAEYLARRNGEAPFGTGSLQRLNDTGTTIRAKSAADLPVIDGPGVIRALRISFAPNDEESARNLWVTISYESKKSPDVSAPAAYLFGVPYGEIDQKTPLVGVEPGGFWYSYFPMPFRNAVRIRFENRMENRPIDSLSWEVLYESLPAPPPPDTGYFQVQYREAAPTAGGSYTILDTRGRGRLVGVVGAFEAADLSREFLEGDDRFYVDGRRSVNGWGTGTDHFFGGVRRFVLDTYAAPFVGQQQRPFVQGQNPKFGAYRWFLTDGVRFDRGITYALEIGTSYLAAVPPVPTYRSAAFFYRSCLAGAKETDSLTIRDFQSQQAHSWEISGETNENAHRDVDALFEGSKELVRANGRAIRGTATQPAEMRFRMAVDALNTGVRLERLLNWSTANQEAQVWIDDRYAGNWLTPGRNGARPAATGFNERVLNSWKEDGFDIPPALTAGKAEIRVRLVWAGGNEFNAYRFSVASSLPADGGGGPGKVPNVQAGVQGLRATLTWDVPATGGVPETYAVYRADSDPGPTAELPDTWLIGITDQRTFVDANQARDADPTTGPGLPPQKTYYYIIVAEDCLGRRGLPSDAARIETGLPPIELEAENLDFAGSQLGTEVEVLDWPDASAGKVVCNKATRDGRFLITRFNVGVSAFYNAAIVYASGPEGGKVQPSFGGVALVTPENAVDTRAAARTVLAPSVFNQPGQSQCLRRGQSPAPSITHRIPLNSCTSPPCWVCVDKIILTGGQGSGTCN